MAEARATANAAAVHAAPNNHAGLIWAIADLLRGDYKRSEYGRVILPLVLLRRLDCVLEPTRTQVRIRSRPRGWPRAGAQGPCELPVAWYTRPHRSSSCRLGERT